jgi:hypothetical protein
MNTPAEPRQPNDELILINGRADIDFWCRRFSISAFTLFQLLKTVGNDARQIGEFLHKSEEESLDTIGEPKKFISIL